MGDRINKLKVADKKQETKDAVSLSMEIPDSLKTIYQYKPGQYITVIMDVDGQEERRAYSMSSAPHENGLTFTIKKVKNGKVSPLLCDQITEQDELKIMVPEGRFTIGLDAAHERSFYMIAAGSGITPIFSLIKSILEEEPKSRVYLLYGNRTIDEVIFKTALDELQHNHEGQLHVHYTYSQQDKKGGLFSSVFGKSNPSQGRIDRKKIDWLWDTYSPKQSSNLYFICGPGDMIDMSVAHLKSKSVPSSEIFQERFFAEALEVSDSPEGASAAQLVATMDGNTVEVPLEAGETIVEALQRAGYDPPYSCLSGTCATCMAKVSEGKADMEVCFALDQDEIEEGYILTCQAKPTTDKIILNYDD